MPGVVVYGRRWLIGSDDLLIPASLLLAVHLICAILISVTFFIQYNKQIDLASLLLLKFKISYLIILKLSIFLEIIICNISLRGTVLNTKPRESIKYWLYAKAVLLIMDAACLTLGSLWTFKYFYIFPDKNVKIIIFILLLIGWIVLKVTLISIYCVYDRNGRSFVNGTLKEGHNKVKYQKTWDHRIRCMFRCVTSQKTSKISDISRIFGQYFIDLDVVPSDIVAGLKLLRKYQIREMEESIENKSQTGILRYISGVPVTKKSRFLNENDSYILHKAEHFLNFATAIYGWPPYIIGTKCGICSMMPNLCCCCFCRPSRTVQVDEGDSWNCNYTALRKTLKDMDVDVIYITYHLDIEEIPFFVAIDYKYKKIVISIRGSLSMADAVTDLRGTNEVLPLKVARNDWLAHKGMLQTAIYIKNKLEKLNLIEIARNRDIKRETNLFELIVTGHSLGAGVTAILGTLLKEEYPNLECFCYSAPGGLLSLSLAEYTKTFITSVVLGEDCTPRVGYRQLENLRADLINVLEEANEPKYKTIICSVFRLICCSVRTKQNNIENFKMKKRQTRNPDQVLENEDGLTLHQTMFPPGRIIHIGKDSLNPKSAPYEAMWAEMDDYDQILIAPNMFTDHLPNSVMAGIKEFTSKYK